MSEDSIDYWRRLVRELTADEFAEEFRCPFLLRLAAHSSGPNPRPSPRVERDSRSRTASPQPTGDFDDLAFKTDVVDLDLVPSRPIGRLTGGKVVPVVKSDRNPFAGRIAVGRAKNCDIVLRDASVSKNHAYFTAIAPSGAELVDTHSQNCTRVNTKPIKPIVPIQVVSGDTIVFGGVVTQFFDARALYLLL